MRIALLSAFLSLGLMACPSWFESDDDDGDEFQSPPVPQVEANAPATDVSLTIGQPVEIRYADDGVGGDTDVIAVRTSDGMQITIALNRPHLDGVEQIVVWNTAGVAAGVWRIEFRSTRDGESSTTTAPGHVTLTPQQQTQPGNAGVDVVNAVATFSDGAYAAAGVYVGQLSFEGGPTLPEASSGALFVARWSADGVRQWVRAITFPGAVFDEDSIPVTTDLVALPDDSVVVTGLYSAVDGRIVVGAGEPDAAELDAPAVSDPGRHSFIARFAPDGALLWAQIIHSPGKAEVRNAAATAGAIVVVGTFEGLTTFGEGQPNLTTIVEDSERWFIAQYTLTGDLIRVLRSQSTPLDDRSRALHVDAFPDGSFVVGGKREGDLLLGFGEANETLLHEDSTEDWVARFHADGTLDWARTTNATNSAETEVQGIAARADGTTILLFENHFDELTLTFPGVPPAMIAVADEGTWTVLVAYDAAGNALWARLLPVRSDGTTNPLARSASGFYLTGIIDEDVVLGPGEPDEQALTQLAGSDTMFLAHYDAEGSLRWATQALAADEHHYGFAVAPRPGGVVLGGANFGEMTLETAFGTVEHVSTGEFDFFVFPIAEPEDAD